jgi:sugar lactone lactonase YvrE
MRLLEATSARALSAALLVLVGGPLACAQLLDLGGLTYTGGTEADASTDAEADAGPELRLLAGKLGGAGSVNGVGDAARFSGASDIKIVGGTAYVADQMNQTIREVALDGGAVTTLAGRAGYVGTLNGPATIATLTDPVAIAFDGNHTLYLAEGASAIRTIDIGTGSVGSVPDSMLQQASGIGLTADGNAIVSETAPTNTILTVTLGDGGATAFPATGGPFIANPSAVAVTPFGTFVADQYESCVVELDLATGTASPYAGKPGHSGASNGPNLASTFLTPSGFASDDAGTLYVADIGNYDIRVITGGQTATFSGSGTAGSADGPSGVATFAAPQGIAPDGAGNLFVADGATIRKVDPTGTVTTFAGTAPNVGTNDDSQTGANVRFAQPQGVAVVGDYAYVVDVTNYVIRQVSTVTGGTTTWAGAGRSGNADGIGTLAQFYMLGAIAADPTGTYLYVLDDGAIRRIDVATAQVETIARGNAPYAIAVDSKYVYVTGGDQQVSRLPTGSTAADAASNVFALIAGTGQTGSANGPGNNATFSNPSGLAVHGNTLYIADTGNALVRALDLTSFKVNTIAGIANSPGFVNGNGTLAQLNRPTAITVDAAGNVFFADGTATIREIDPNNDVTTFAGQQGHGIDQPGPLPASLNDPAGLAFTPDGGLVITEPNEVSVLIIR